MKGRDYTARGRRVNEFLVNAPKEYVDIAMLLWEVLDDERAALKFGLVQKRRKGAPDGRNDRRHIQIATDYLIELHRLGGKETRGAKTAATEKVTREYGIDERELRRYRNKQKLQAYVRYRLAVLDGEYGLSGEPDIPADVEAELRRLAEGFKREMAQRTKELRELLRGE